MHFSASREKCKVDENLEGLLRYAKLKCKIKKHKTWTYIAKMILWYGFPSVEYLVMAKIEIFKGVIKWSHVYYFLQQHLAQKYSKCQLTFYIWHLFHAFIIWLSKMLIKLRHRQSNASYLLLSALSCLFSFELITIGLIESYCGHDITLNYTKWQKRVKHKNLLMINANENDYDD